MPARTECPVCRSVDVQPLLELSKLAEVDYLRCWTCRHVWNVRKGFEEPIQHVTEVPRARLA